MFSSLHFVPFLFLLPLVLLSSSSSFVVPVRGDSLNAEFGSVWTSVTPINGGFPIRNSHSQVTYQTSPGSSSSYIYVLGGTHRVVGSTPDYRHYNDVWRTPVTDLSQWTQIAGGTWITNSTGQVYVSALKNATTSFWPPRDDFNGVVTYDGKAIIIAGGQTINASFSPIYLNDVWASFDQGFTWVEQTSNAGWVPRFGFGLDFLSDNSLVLAGGNSYGIHQQDVWVSKDYGVSWTRLETAAPFASSVGRADFAMVSVPPNSIESNSNPLVVLTGGEKGPPNTFNDVWRSENDGANWTQVIESAPWLPRFQHIGVLARDTILISGGRYRNLTAFWHSDAWLSRDGGLTWTQVAQGNPILCRGHHGASVFQTSDGASWVVVVTAGQSTAGDLNDIISTTMTPFTPNPNAANKMGAINSLVCLFSIAVSLLLAISL